MCHQLFYPTAMEKKTAKKGGKVFGKFFLSGTGEEGEVFMGHASWDSLPFTLFYLHALLEQ